MMRRSHTTGQGVPDEVAADTTEQVRLRLAAESRDANPPNRQ
jgi:hypothetical protein